jgi:hypothetical protein
MSRRFTRGPARWETAAGVITMLGGGLVALWFVMVGVTQSTELFRQRLVWAGFIFGAGVLLGLQCIVFSRLILVFLDIRRRLERLDRRSARRERRGGPESPATRRLIPR